MAGEVPIPGLRVNGLQIGEGRTDPITVGRSPSSDVVVSNPVVSGRHATIALEAGTWVFRDAGSTNGTYLDGVRTDAVAITGRTVLMLGHPVEGSPLDIETVVAPAPEAMPAVAEAAPVSVEPTAPFTPAPMSATPPPPPAAPASPAAPPISEAPPPAWAPVPAGPPGAGGGSFPPASPTGGPPPVLQSRVVWTRRLQRDEPGVLKLEGDRVVFESDGKGRLIDAPLAGLDATFPRPTTMEVHHGAKTFHLSFPEPYGQQAAAAWRQLIESHQGAAPPMPGAPVAGGFPTPQQQGWDGSGAPPPPR
jgi:hypothetical protein